MYTSKNTSVNSKRPASVYDYIGFDMENKKVLDYGCGKYWETSKEYAKKFKPERLYFYDPYWMQQSLRFCSFDIIICANVLNVVENERILKFTIANVLNLLDIGGKAYFQIYEGDRSGTGKETKEDCWQRNEKTKNYLRYFERYSRDYEISIYKNYITITDKMPF